MFKVSRRGNGFRISIGNHRPADACTIDEVKEALEHYYTVSHYPLGHVHTCPFCRRMAASARKGRKE